MGKLSFLPAFIGFWVGVLFLLLLDRLIPHLLSLIHISHDELAREDGLYRRFLTGREKAVGWKL